MTSNPRRWLRRPLARAGCGLVLLVLTACTGRGGGQLPPDPAFPGSASFGFTFTCEDVGIGGLPGRLRTEVSYTEKSRTVGPFSVHGTVEDVDSVTESMFCSGDEPPPGGDELVFTGRYRVTSSAPPTDLGSCADEDQPWCRFEVSVRDSDGSRGPSTGDLFSIVLTGVTDMTGPCPGKPADTCYITEFSDSPVLYARAGVLSSGNLTVD